jgi:hypothetical protein
LSSSWRLMSPTRKQPMLICCESRFRWSSESRAVRRAHELPRAAQQPAAHSAGSPGLRASRALACAGLARRGAGGGTRRRLAHQAASRSLRWSRAQHAAHPAVSGFAMAQCGDLYPRDEPTALAPGLRTAHGPPDDTRMARNPGRGGGCHRPIALHTPRQLRDDIQGPHRASKPASMQPFNPHSGHCVKYSGWRCRMPVGAGAS